MTRDKGKLTPKQERFVQEYLVDLNATQAATRAGYSKKTAQEQSSRLLSNVMVSKAITERRARLLDDAESRGKMVLDRLEHIINANILDYLDLTDPHRPVFDLSRITRDHGTVIEDFSFDLRNGKPRIKLYDKNAALAHLGRFLGLSKERHEHSGLTGGQLPNRVELVFVKPPERE